MSSVPIAVKFSQDGQAQVIASLKNIEKNTKNVKASTIAYGAIMAKAFTESAKFVKEFALNAIKDAGEMAKAAREGKEVAAEFTDAGLAGAENLITKATEFQNKLKAAFINSTPMLMEFVQAAIAQFRYWITGSIDTVKIFFKNFGENIPILGKNFGILFKWIGDNWHSLAVNMGKILYHSVINSLSNIKNFITAVFEWVKGNGWNYVAKDLLDGANLIKLPKIEFEEFKGGDEIKAAWEEAAKIRDARLQEIVKEREVIETTIVRQPPKEEKKKEKKEAKLEAPKLLIRGSSEAASFITQTKLNGQMQSIALKQLRAQETQVKSLQTIAENTAKFTGDIKIEEVDIA